ncbi:uncharacterized protein LOC132727111 isoform X1 [Ruditapes philippinarum]|uniref:uncharacterized protein LOC132727111 isoform X1 n=2 Tax=Ruditapes philippinarum TaxID=129788 RepID=UPI00295B4B48|nr:uncharacterized protein LOC132727111 isoform X1 [Ruditapes philippinarum]
MNWSTLILCLFAAVFEVSSVAINSKPSTGVFSTDNALQTSDLEKGGWQMVFRAASGNGDSVYDAWLKGTKTNADKPVSMKRSLALHYRDPIVDNWPQLGVKYVKFAFYDEDKEVAHVIFDGANSDIKTWFAKQNVLTSSWPDLTSTQSYNHFSIDGHNDNNRQDRRFFINKLYAGCPKDLGYLVVINSETLAVCSLDNHATYPQFLYSKVTSVDYWDRRMFGTADFMAIFIKRSV